MPTKRKGKGNSRKRQSNRIRPRAHAGGKGKLRRQDRRKLPLEGSLVEGQGRHPSLGDARTSSRDSETGKRKTAKTGFLRGWDKRNAIGLRGIEVVAGSDGRFEVNLGGKVSSKSFREHIQGQVVYKGGLVASDGTKDFDPKRGMASSKTATQIAMEQVVDLFPRDRYEESIAAYCDSLKVKLLAKYRKGRMEHGQAHVHINCKAEVNQEVLDIINYFLIDKVNGDAKKAQRSASQAR